MQIFLTQNQIYNTGTRMDFSFWLFFRFWLKYTYRNSRYFQTSGPQSLRAYVSSERQPGFSHAHARMPAGYPGCRSKLTLGSKIWGPEVEK